MTQWSLQEPFDFVEVRFKNGRKEFFKNVDNLQINIGEVLAPLIFDGLLGVVAGLVIVLFHVAYTRLFKTNK